MRLLNVLDLHFQEFRDDNRPPYVAASHRWLDCETTFHDARDGRNTDNAGYRKVKAFAKYVREQLAPIEWLWIDTCCINKENAAELSESINSMFEWYESSAICFAYMSDVERVSDTEKFEKSLRFERGWTLQELLAPRLVIFVAAKWEVIGHKGHATSLSKKLALGHNLEGAISRRTGIPEDVLHDYAASATWTAYDKIKWIEGRQTTRPEDMSYALYGILGITIGANYGERYHGARQRLMAAITARDNAAAQRAEQYRSIVTWLSAPDPYTNHDSARQMHEAHTGEWLLHHPRYLSWKDGRCRVLWLSGKVGCGKTVLSSTAIEDMRGFCQHRPDVGHAFFYFTFSDDHKQSYPDLVTSLIAQLGNREPGLSRLRQAYENTVQRQLALRELEEILFCCIASYDKVYIHLDALDESPENRDLRQNVLEGIRALLARAPNAHVLATSREIADIGDCMKRLDADPVSVMNAAVYADINRYISSELARHCDLSRLNETAKSLIQETLSKKADGMFRWVYCQLQLLKQTKSTRPSAIRGALQHLPKDLDETYERMLNSISDSDRQHALTLLRWITYSNEMLSLEQLAEACVIEPNDERNAEGIVNVGNRGDWQDTFKILGGLVIFIPAVKRPPPERIDKGVLVRLAHFSVKEYLESSRILQGVAMDFYLDPGREHRHLAQSCIVYLIHYSKSSEKVSGHQDFKAFPLLRYCANAWISHARLQNDGSAKLEVTLLASDRSRFCWLAVHDPDHAWRRPFMVQEPRNLGGALYYAALLGRTDVAQALLKEKLDLDAHGGYCGTALQAASLEGHESMIATLLANGADVNAVQGKYGHALQAASLRGHKIVVEMLISKGANIDAQAGQYGCALQAASFEGHEKIARILLAKGAKVNSRGGEHGYALIAASCNGELEVAKLLLTNGANVNAYGGQYHSALQAASQGGHTDLVHLLLSKGADVNAAGGEYRYALHAAAQGGHMETVESLLAAGADIDARDDKMGRTASEAASVAGFRRVVRLLLDKGAAGNAKKLLDLATLYLSGN